jgi:hypothetical protein
VSAGTTAIREPKEFQVSRVLPALQVRTERRDHKEKLSRDIRGIRERPERRDLKETLEDPRERRELKEF